MAHAGQIIENPVSGERITFRKTAADTGGELLELDLELTADGHVPGMHVHPAQEERFELLSGTVRFQKGLRRVTAEAGDVVVVEPGKAHKFENVGGEVASMRVQVRPAGPAPPAGRSAPRWRRSPGSPAAVAAPSATSLRSRPTRRSLPGPPARRKGAGWARDAPASGAGRSSAG